ncbi:hypothetical protein [Trueperella pyogenes]|uniref:hypothetical protein n=1 Tax=Trueperella pyogenes TaxID=1661 RepID=UPI003DA80A86
MSIDNDVIGKKNTSFGLIKDPSRQMPDGYLSKTPMFQYILVSICFPMWGAAASLNDILITQFKTIFTLSDFASAFVQSAFYGGYFLLAIPASRIIRKWSYKSGILIGLCFYIIGCTMFFPASHMATYSVFLAALFAIATGLFFPRDVVQHLFLDARPTPPRHTTPQHLPDFLPPRLNFRHSAGQVPHLHRRRGT